MRKLFQTLAKIVFSLQLIFSAAINVCQADQATVPHVAVLNMDLMILPGTSAYVERALESAAQNGAQIAVININTPGGLLNAAQDMVQAIFKSPIPVVVYVSPTGSTATSAGVFITLAGHVAAMAHGTSMGAAHPVTGGGEDIQGDMRTKVENMAIKLVQSIAEERKRNVDWATKSVKDSSTVTDKEALQLGVIDIVAQDIPDLLKRIKGKEVKLPKGNVIIADYSSLPLRVYEMGVTEKAVNLFANPNVVALLWAAATGGLSIELYNPGAILPGVVGVICLILALGVSDAIPVTTGGVLLLVLGAVLIGIELFVPSGILAIGGLISIVLGMVYLIDTTQAPDLRVSLEFILPLAAALGFFLLFLVRTVVKTLESKVTTGKEGLLGQYGKALNNISTKGKVDVNGEIWNACAKDGIIEQGSKVRVVSMGPGLKIEVERAE